MDKSQLNVDKTVCMGQFDFNSSVPAMKSSSSMSNLVPKPKTLKPQNLKACLQAVFYALQTDLGLHLNDLATMTLIQAQGSALSKDPNNRVPLKGVIGGYVGIYGDYIRVQGPK